MSLFKLSLDQLPPPGCRGGVISIGNFDGVYLGHQALVAEAKRQGAFASRADGRGHVRSASLAALAARDLPAAPDDAGPAHSGWSGPAPTMSSPCKRRRLYCNCRQTISFDALSLTG